MSGKTTLKLNASTASVTSDNVDISNNVITKWATSYSEIVWDVKFEKTGKLDVSIELANEDKNAGAEIEVDINGEKTSGITTPTGGLDKFATIPLGTIEIKKSGLFTVKVRALTKKGAYVGDLKCVKLFGPPASAAEEYEIPSRIDTVKLLYKDEGGCDYFYNQVKINSSFPGTYFQVCGFQDGNFGLQETDFSGRKIVIFSLWDSIKGQKTSLKDRSALVSQGEGVEIQEPSKENNKWQCIFPYKWEFNEIYQFLVKLLPDEDTKSVLYSAYFYIEDKSRWKHLVTYKVENEKRLMLGLNSFMEDLFGRHGRFPREAVFGPGFCHKPNGEWLPLRSAVFSQDGSHKNTTAGVSDDGRLFLKAGRRTFQDVKVGTELIAKTDPRLPDILDDIDSQLKF